MKNLKDLPYGTVIEYRKKRYYKCQGLDGDIVMSEKDGGTWHFIKDLSNEGCSTINWKSFRVLYSPTPLPE